MLYGYKFTHKDRPRRGRDGMNDYLIYCICDSNFSSSYRSATENNCVARLCIKYNSFAVKLEKINVALPNIFVFFSIRPLLYHRIKHVLYCKLKKGYESDETPNKVSEFKAKYDDTQPCVLTR